MCDEQEIYRQFEEVVKLLQTLVFDLRQNMTSVTRYVKHTKANKPNHIKMEVFNRRHVEYQALAEQAVNNILDCLNNNERLREFESIKFLNAECLSSENYKDRYYDLMSKYNALAKIIQEDIRKICDELEAAKNCCQAEDAQ